MIKLNIMKMLNTQVNILKLCMAMLMMFSFVACDDFPTGSKDEESETPYTYVDMGLSVAWAAYNVGAEAECGVGYYFAWGETEPASLENIQTYKYGDPFSGQMSKYNELDDKLVLEMNDDAARKHWGGYWRMPTTAEFMELLENCIVEPAAGGQSSQNDVTMDYGLRFTSKITGNSIFFPAAGYYDYYRAEQLGFGDQAYYWSSVLEFLNEDQQKDVATAYSFSATLRDEDFAQSLLYAKRPMHRYMACNVRAVYDTLQASDYPFVYTLQYDANGGSGNMKTMSHNKGESIKVAANSFLRDGYYFSHWNTQADGSGGNYDINQVFALSQDTVLYAQWKEKPEDIIAMTQGFENNYEWADLGLSVKWAVCNLGAATPESYGDYYAWGEAESKTSFTPDNYVTTSSDAAQLSMGGTWRQPTYNECMELLEKCTCVWYSQNGVDGCLIRSNINGRSIFIPAAGCYFNIGNLSLGFQANFWASTPFDPVQYPNLHFRFGFQPGGFSGGYLLDNDYNGMSIRAVCQ